MLAQRYISTFLMAGLLVTILTVALIARPGDQAFAGTSPFTDIDGSPFRADIEWLHAEGITAGCEPTLFCPRDPVTREQMASFLARMFELPPTQTDYFLDDETTIHEADINSLAAAGITTGCTATTLFCPDVLVTRAHMASFMARAAELSVGAGRDYFSDDHGMHEGNIDRSAAAGITSGCGGWHYCPMGTVTREQMAAFLHRVTSPIPPPPYPWETPQVSPS